MSARVIAVPFRAKLPSDWKTGKEMVVTERRVEGIVRLVEDDLALELRVVEDVTTVGGSDGYAMDKKMSDVTELHVPLSRVVTTRFRRWWWGPRLTIVTDSLRLFEDVPGAEQGRLNLRIARRDSGLAESLDQEVRLRLADLALRRVEGSLEEDFRRLTDGD